ncbi:MAG TPA: S9 family peptidase [Woeseiaceae bacterium]|nr:S9 family peptidase [Woeseiaceae bacterium]
MHSRLWLLVAVLACAACDVNARKEPMPEKKPHKLEIHGDVRVDDYYWLRERDNPDVIAYLEAENAHADSVMATYADLHETVLAELKSRIKPEDESVPFRDGDYFYYFRYEEGKEYPVYCRRKGSLDAPEEVLLDVNAGAAGHDYYSVRGFTVSPDHTKAVYGVDTRGRRFYTLHFLDLETGEPLPDVIENVTGNAEWAADSRTLLYARQDPDTLRSYQVWRHELGVSGDTLVYQEDDEANSLWVEKSLAGRYLFLVSAETVSTEVRYLPADAPNEEPRLFLPRSGEHEYFVTDGEDRFYVLSNDGAVNFQLFEVPLDDTSREAWKAVVPHRDNVLIESVEVLRNFLVLNTMEDGLAQIEVVSRANGERYKIAFDEPAYTVYPSDNHVYDTKTLRFVYESMTTPESTFDYDLVTRERTLLREEEVPGGFDKSNYRAERVYATARDGTKIPVSMVYRKGMEKNGRNPLLQYGYGAYGITVEPDFDADRLTLLDRGFIYAIAHIRGGSLYGREWYYAGRQLRKMNTFTDFIDVSRFLIEEGYTSPEHLYAYGGSAGGLLIGAVVNMAPELYHGVATRVPFVDVVTTMLDESIPLTTFEFDEWGNPAEKVFYDYMMQYSPYDNVKPQRYPHMLVTTGLHDSQVQYWEPAKWVAKIRDLKTDDNLLLLKTDMQAGHSGKTGRFRSLEDTALVYAFFLHLERSER